VERLENLETLIEGTLKDIYEGLSQEKQAGIRIALTCKDIPKIAEVSLDAYFTTMKKLHSHLPDGLACAEHIMKRDTILFQCS
jgi:hypothetical protein